MNPFFQFIDKLTEPTAAGRALASLEIGTCSRCGEMALAGDECCPGAGVWFEGDLIVEPKEYKDGN